MNTLKTFNQLKGTLRPFQLVSNFSTKSVLQSGHSKWETIKRDKAKNDALKSSVSFKLATRITMMVKMGGPDLSANLSLAYAVDKAKELNVPKRVIENAIKRGTGELKSQNDNKVETAIYEGLGPGGFSLIIEVATDNKNRSLGAIKPIFNKHGGKLTSVAYLFEKKGMILCDFGNNQAEKRDEDDILEEMIDLGCEDVNKVEEEVDPDEIPSNKPSEDVYELITDVNELGKIANQLKDKKYTIKEMQIGYLPKQDTKVSIEDEEMQATIELFLKQINDLDDVTNVFTNIEE